MSEHEEELRAMFQNVHNRYAVGVGKMHAALDALLSEHRAALSRARAEALEEAANIANAQPGGFSATIARLIRERIDAPAPATIPVERVREVLKGIRGEVDTDNVVARNAAHWTCDEAARRLGVDLDAKGEACGKCYLKRGTCEDCAALARGEHQQAYWTDGAAEAARPADLARCGCGDYALSHRDNIGLCIINGCECSGFRAAEAP